MSVAFNIMHNFRNNLTHRNDRVTAQDSASIARARRLGCLNRRTERNNGGQIRAPHQRGRGGGRKKGESRDGDGGEAREHHRDRVERGVGELSAAGNAG